MLLLLALSGAREAAAQDEPAPVAPPAAEASPGAGEAPPLDASAPEPGPEDAAGEPARPSEEPDAPPIDSEASPASPEPPPAPGEDAPSEDATGDPLLADAPLPETMPTSDALSASPLPDAAAVQAVVTTGEVAFEARAFEDDDDPSTRDFGIGLFSRLELKAEHGAWSFVARGYARADARDEGRSLAVLERLFVGARWSWLELRAGVDLFDWSATEAFHPADILNARNLDGEFERYEKVGEPMASLGLRWDTGNVTAYYLPYRTFPILPSRRSRLDPFPREAAIGPYRVLGRDGELSDDRFAPQGALRLVQKLGATDLSLHLVHHMDRSQLEILVDPESFELDPLLRHVTQAGGTLQTVLEPFIFKLEVAYRKFAEPEADSPLAGLPDRDHLALAAGADYGWLWGDAESTLILEYQQLLLTSEARRRELSPFPHDVLLGYRLALSDPDDTVFNASVIADTHHVEQMFFNVSAERRLFGQLRASVALRFANDIQPWTTWHIPADYDHVRVSIARKF